MAGPRPNLRRIPPLQWRCDVRTRPSARAAVGQASWADPDGGPRRDSDDSATANAGTTWPAAGKTGADGAPGTRRVRAATQRPRAPAVRNTSHNPTATRTWTAAAHQNQGSRRASPGVSPARSRSIRSTRRKAATCCTTINGADATVGRARRPRSNDTRRAAIAKGMPAHARILIGPEPQVNTAVELRREATPTPRRWPASRPPGRTIPADARRVLTAAEARSARTASDIARGHPAASPARFVTRKGGRVAVAAGWWSGARPSR